MSAPTSGDPVDDTDETLSSSNGKGNGEKLKGKIDKSDHAKVNPRRSGANGPDASSTPDT
jgi:hypothetical protein